MVKAIPEEALPTINIVETGTIPDVAAGSADYDDDILWAASAKAVGFQARTVKLMDTFH